MKISIFWISPLVCNINPLLNNLRSCFYIFANLYGSTLARYIFANVPHRFFCYRQFPSHNVEFIFSQTCPYLYLFQGPMFLDLKYAIEMQKINIQISQPASRTLMLEMEWGLLVLYYIYYTNNLWFEKINFVLLYFYRFEAWKS